MLLELDEIYVHYGKIEAISGISLDVDEGEIVTLIGANGAGKSTTLKTISGLRTVSRGEIRFDGQVITRMAGHKRVLAGIGQAPEGRGIFPGMTVAENLHMGAYARKDDSSNELAEAYDLFPRLAERKRQAAGTMSGGEQQMLAIGRALMARPRLLLLDEPSLGLAPILVQRIFDVIARLKSEQVTLLLVEQNARMALDVADRGYVMETGRIKLTGPAAELAANPEVERAYLGG
jgi:branched-chain amino acid transport system ATP-binding protein